MTISFLATSSSCVTIATRFVLRGWDFITNSGGGRETSSFTGAARRALSQGYILSEILSSGGGGLFGKKLQKKYDMEGRKGKRRNYIINTLKRIFLGSKLNKVLNFPGFCFRLGIEITFFRWGNMIEKQNV